MIVVSCDMPVLSCKVFSWNLEYFDSMYNLSFFNVRVCCVSPNGNVESFFPAQHTRHNEVIVVCRYGPIGNSPTPLYLNLHWHMLRLTYCVHIKKKLYILEDYVMPLFKYRDWYRIIVCNRTLTCKRQVIILDSALAYDASLILHLSISI